MAEPPQTTGAGALWEADPFYSAAEALQEEMDTLEAEYAEWSGRESSAEQDGDEGRGQLLAACDSVRGQLGEFHRAVSAMTEAPERFHISQEELERRFSFVKDLSGAEARIRHAILTGNLQSGHGGRQGRALHTLVGSPGQPTHSAEAAAREAPSSRGHAALEAAEVKVAVGQPAPDAGYGPPAPRTPAAGALWRRLLRSRRCVVFSGGLAALLLWLSSAFGEA